MEHNQQQNSAHSFSSSSVRHSSRLAGLQVGQKRFSTDASNTPLSPKRVKIAETAASPSVLSARKKVSLKKMKKLRELRRRHVEHITEEYFINNRGLILDYSTWRAHPPSNLDANLKSKALDVDIEEMQKELDALPDTPPKSTTTIMTAAAGRSPGRGTVVSGTASIKDIIANAVNVTVDIHPKDIVDPFALHIPEKASSSITPSSVSSVIIDNNSNDNNNGYTSNNEKLTNRNESLNTSMFSTESVDSRSDVSTPVTFRPQIGPPASVAEFDASFASISSYTAPSTSSAFKTSKGAHLYSEGSIERAAKQEAHILRRVAELRRDGLWSAKKMPKCLEPARNKTHWDYLLEEMQWMAIDFEQERKWKRSAAKKLASSIAKQKREMDDRERKQELEKEKELKRIASFIAREIKQFWNNIEKVVEYKTENIVEAKKKRALDKHLDFIVVQSEKYSSLIQQGLNKLSSPFPSSSAANDDVEFEVDESSDDDETTIAKAEEHEDNSDVEDEVAQLQKESEADLDNIINSLPAGYVEEYGLRYSTGLKSKSESNETASVGVNSDDDEDMSDAGESSKSFQASSSSHDSIDFKKLKSSNSEERQKELNHIAETAEKLLPKGFTLDSVNIVTKQPFLLKHDLREYQRVGLDWLVTLYEKKLNGILADEMGLGKTIQTIALLAYLACEKRNWGPHLIVVPTTVLLNWEMECKKWCPAFKVLTYYGSLKDRKEKRKGWSKTNSFHICITSYKLVLQDNLVFRRKNWQYLVLDEAQNIKNFKSQRWQMLLNFKTERRLLLTGTPLQNSLMELWSLMHFLMPHVFGSHKDFRDWFSNPLTGMIEGTQEFNEQTVKRLHKVLRPFLLRRLKSDVERQLPKKFEHLLMCQLSKRQRYLYDDFMSKGSTKSQLASGNVMSVMNILMQLRKVCNHPFLFEPRPILSPFVMRHIEYKTAGLVCDITGYDPLKHVRIRSLINNEAYDKIRALRLSELCEGFPRQKPEEVVDPPKISGFTFKPSAELQARLALKHTNTSDNGVKRLQFVIPNQIAQSMNLKEPFFLQMATPSGHKYVPVIINDASIDFPDSTTGLNNTAILSDSVKKAPILRLVPQKSNLFHTVPFGTSLSVTTLPCGTKTAEFSARPGTVSASNSIQLGGGGTFARNSPISIGIQSGQITAKTVLSPKPKIPPASTASFLCSTSTHTITSITTGSSIFPSITVRDVLPKNPTICLFDPNKVKTPAGGVRLPASFTPAVTTTSAVVELNRVLVPVKTSGSSSSISLNKTMRQSQSATLSASSAADKFYSSVNAADSKNYGKALAAFQIVTLRQKRIEQRLNRCMRLLSENRRRCRELPIYGENLRRICNVARPGVFNERLVSNWDQRLTLLKPLLDRFCIAIPSAKTNVAASLRVSRRHAYNENVEESALINCYRSIIPYLSPLTSIIASQSIQFPELRLIEYDCGKLQRLALLLRQLKQNGSRCLIFTQMTRMLDILEAFLCYHGYTYLRLDGATRIEHRQILMERFNHDTRVFCFILSTRSGGIGVNLTGANAVIFYDSDWNPTMDAQAQDRCHRIGQTRDVHIYRLISEKTVEENILKKAMQKRKLGEIAIEEGEFTSEFFKKSNILDIFELIDADVSKVKSVSQQELEQAMSKVEDERDVVAARVARGEAVAELAEFDDNQNFVENEVETDPDVVKVEQEMKHLMDQLKPVERYAVKYLEALAEPDRLNEVRQTEEEIESRKKKWEEVQEIERKEKLKQKREIEDEEFELTYQMSDAITQMVSSVDPMDVLFTWCPPTPPLSDDEFDPYYEPTLGFLYDRTPIPECDLPPIYVDPEVIQSPTKVITSVDSLFSSGITTTFNDSSSSPANISSSQSFLSSPILVQQQTPISKAAVLASNNVSPIQTVAQQKSKDVPQQNQQQHQHHPPSSHNHHPPAPQRDLFTSQLGSKLKQTARRQITPPPGTGDNDTADVVHEWNIAEDFYLLNAVTKVQQTSYSLSTANAGHGVNWDLVSECVSSSCGRYRSPKQCHKRYETAIMPREEGRPAFMDAVSSSKKSRKSGGLQEPEIKTKKFRIRTTNQFQLEGQHFMTTFVGRKFHNVSNMCNKRNGLTKRSGYGICVSSPSNNISCDDRRATMKISGSFIKTTPPTASTAVTTTPSKFLELFDEKIRLREMEEKRKLQIQQQQQANALGRTPVARSLLQSQLQFSPSAPGTLVTVGTPQRSSMTTNINFPAVISRPSSILPVSVSTAAVYRQVAAQQNFKLQRTPPGTPGPAITLQPAGGGGSAAFQITCGSGGGGVARSIIEPALLGTVVVQSQAPPHIIPQPPSDFTALIKQPQTLTAGVRFHNLAGSGRQKIQVTPQSTHQYSGGGSFLVSAEVSKPNISGHQLATILQPGGRISSSPLRTQLQLSAGAASSQQFRKHSPIPRVSTIQGGFRSPGMGSVHVISQTGRLSTAGGSPVLSKAQSSTSLAHQLLASSNSSNNTNAVSQTSRASIPSVSNILPSSSGGRLEALTVGPTIIIQQHHQYPPPNTITTSQP